MTVDLKTSELPAVTSLSGSELIPVVQTSESRQATISQVRAGLAAGTHAHAIADTTGLQAELDGKLAQGRQTIWLPAAGLVARTTNGATAGAVETTTNKVMHKTLDFDPATTQYAQFAIGMPKSWNEGAVRIQFVWTAASGSGAVVWGVQGLALSDGDATDAAFGSAETVTDTLLSAGACHISAETADLTLAGLPTEGDLAVLQVFRSAADAADTLGVAANLLGVRLFYTVNAGNDA